ncbi:hypothetical protein MRBLWH3_001940 [Microbacterium sp. LWH3-1.2]
MSAITFSMFCCVVPAGRVEQDPSGIPSLSRVARHEFGFGDVTADAAAAQHQRALARIRAQGTQTTADAVPVDEVRAPAAIAVAQHDHRLEALHGGVVAERAV